MDEQAKRIWGRGSARQIMKEARDRFEKSKLTGDVVYNIVGQGHCLTGPATPPAHVELASTHYSLVKRYLVPWWKKPLAVWHFWRALKNIDKATAKVTPRDLSVEQIDVVTRIWSQSPNFLGGRTNRAAALAMLSYALRERMGEGHPHTHAHLLIAKRNLLMGVGDRPQAIEANEQARKLIRAIEASNASDWRQQLVRVMSEVALFELEQRCAPDRWFPEKLLQRALDLARESGAYDQVEKILADKRR